jgi:hypothetical protein
MEWLAIGGTAALFTFLATGWNTIKNLWSQAKSRVIVTIECNGTLVFAMPYYILTQFQQSVYGDRRYLGWLDYVRTNDRTSLIGAEILGANSLYWKGWRPIWVSSGGSGCTVTMTFIRGLFNGDNLIREATHAFNASMYDQKQSNYYVKTLSGTAGKPMSLTMESSGSAPTQMRSADSGFARSDGPSGDVWTNRHQSRLLTTTWNDLKPAKRVSIEDGLALSSGPATLLDRIDRWTRSREWFIQRQIPYRFSAMLHGAPGTGKTSFVRAVGERYGMPVFVFDLASFYNDEFRKEWRRCMTVSPCIVLIEDIDRVFHGDSPANDHIQLTLDALLNQIDGVEGNNGLLLFITANDTTKVSPALCDVNDSKRAKYGTFDTQLKATSRPGRVDISVEFGSLGLDERWKIVNRIMAGVDFEKRMWLVQSTADMTGAQVENLAIDMALDAWHAGKHEPEAACAAA